MSFSLRPLTIKKTFENRRPIIGILVTKERGVALMPNLSGAAEERQYTIKGLNGDNHFLSRITSVGLTVGGVLGVVRNSKRMPVLVYARDTMLAIDKKEAANIQVEVNE